MKAMFRRYISSSLANQPKQEYDPSDLLERARTTDPILARQALVTHYTGLAAAIASHYAYHWPAKDLDILAEAVLALTEAVNSVVNDAAVTADHMPKRIHIRIQGAIKNYLAADAPIRLPSTSAWFQKKVKEEGNSAYTDIQNMESFDAGLIDVSYGSSFDDVVIRDILAHRVFSDPERQLLLLRMQGYSDVEIAVQLNCSKAWVGQIKKEAGRKLLAIVKGQY
jgi:DNA-directed RNA polymerase specialized sigma subunit